MGDVHDASYYAKSMVAGILACGLTHAAICPLDIVKCRKQVNSHIPTKHKLCLVQRSDLFVFLSRSVLKIFLVYLLFLFLLGQPRDVQVHR